MKKSLAERLHCDVAEAERVILALYSAFPRLREYVKEQQDYIMEHEGRINSILGDRLVVPEWKYYLKAKQKGDQREMNSLVSRIQRLGVNLPINNIVAFKSNLKVNKDVNYYLVGVLKRELTVKAKREISC